MRFSLLSTAAVAIAAATLGCAQVAGIEDISSSTAAQHCVDTLNKLRGGAAPVARWTDEEQCADESALAWVQNPGGGLPPCAGGKYPAESSTSEVIDADTFLQEFVNEIYSGDPNLAQASLKRVACGFGSTGSGVGAALFTDP